MLMYQGIRRTSMESNLLKRQIGALSFSLLIGFFLTLNPTLSIAQISVDQASTSNEVESLVENVLLGSCVTASNVNFIGPASSAGTFDASGTGFTMQNGILLTTGQANTAVGPDNDNDAGTDQGTVGDADLTALAGVTTFDGVILEFDFVPEDDTLHFNYVFASEEYPEWVNTQFNDVFGFFISGPGISGPYVNGAENIALIPGTTTPVAINNVNNGYSATEPAGGPCTNCAYYTDNSSGPDVQYDGYTTVLTAEAIVTPCQTYHIRLAIADAGDHIYDSGVFLEAGSFSAGGGITVNFTDLEIEEGCSNEYIVFRRVDLSNNSTAISATYSIGGTATPGVDYSAFPNIVTIPAGEDSVIVNINVPLDFTIEGTETIIVNMDQPPCDCLAPGSATINVIDNDVPLALTTTGETTICLGQSANLTASTSGSLPPYTGSWNNGAPAGDNVTVSPTTTTTYTYTVTDACNSQSETSSETITVIRPDVLVLGQAVQCLSGNSFSFTNTGSSGAGITHSWNFGDGNSSSNENPTHSYAASGTYTVTQTVTHTASGCSTSASTTVTVWEHPTVTATVDQNVICAGGTDGAISTSVSGGQPGYTYSWAPSGQTGANASGLSVGVHTVTVTDANGCSGSDSETIIQNDPVDPTISCPPTANLNTDAGLCTASGSIGTPTTSDNCEVASTVVDNSGPYPVGTTTVTWTVTDVNGNTATCSQDVVVTDNENPTVSCPATANLNTDAGLCTASGSIGTPTASDNCGVASTVVDNSGPYPVGTTTVTWTVTDVNGNVSTCTQDVVVTDNENPTVSCPATANLSTDAGLCTASGSIGTPTTSDNCGVATSVVSNSGPYPVGTTTVTWTVTDVNGNVSTCTQDVVVTDNENPNAVCQNITVQLDVNGSASITAAQIDGGSTDNCGVASISASTTSFDCSNVGSNNVTLTVTDVNGNVSTCTAVVTVEDSVDPVALCNNITVQLDASGTATIVAADVDGGSSDNCIGSSLAIDVSSFDCSNLGTNLVTLTITDANGNSASCVATVTVEDIIDPVLHDCPLSFTVTPDSSDCAPAVSWTEPTATDNCSATITSSHSPGDSFSVGTTTVTYTATDPSGNAVSCSFDVTITPSTLSATITPSTVQCGANVSCNGATDGSATANPVGGCLPYSYSWSDGQTTQTATGLGAGNYIVTITDGNGTVITETITLTEPDELVISAFEVSEVIGGANVSCNGADDGSIDLTIDGGATCEPYDISWVGPNGFSSTDEDISNLEAGTYTVTIEDINGCSVSQSFTLTEPDGLVPTCTSEDALCNGDANGSVEVSVTGGSIPYTYLWSNGNTNASQSGLTAGTYSVTVTDVNGCTTTCSSVVGEPDALGAVVDVQDETLVNGCNGSATANPTGGTGPFTYQWSDGQTTQTAVDLCAGIYTVTITDANGCTYTTSNVINPPTCDLDVTVSSTDVSCNGGTDGTVTATPITGQNNTPFTYLWNNGATTQTVSGLSAGPYSVVVTDSIGCEASGSVVVSEPTLLTVSTIVVDEQTFQGCDGSATANPNGGTPPYSYDWSDGQTTQTASNLCPGTYTVTVTDANGCTEVVTITINPLLCTGFSVAVNTTGLSCFEAGDGSAEAVVTGGTAPFTYSWSNGASTSSISGLDAGTYTVTVTDAVNCVQMVSGNVTQPALLEAATAVDNVTCHGVANGAIELTVTGGTSPYSFLWSNGSTSEDLNGLEPGTFSVDVVDANGCTTDASGTVTQPDTLEASSVDVQVSCNGVNDGSIDLTIDGGLGPYLVSWSNGESTEDIADLAAGTYIATIVDQNGCVYVYSTTISEPGTLTLDCSSEDAICNGDANGSVSVSVTGGTEPYTYAWSNGSSNASQSGLLAGTYSVTVTDANGCSDVCIAVVGEPDPLVVVVDVQDETIVNGCNGFATANPTGGTPPYSYAWSDGQTTQTAIDLCAGIIEVTVTDANGCTYTTSNVINPPTCDLDVDVTGTDVSCNEGSDGTITATPITAQNNTPFTYLWNTGATTQTVSGVTAGPYSVVVTDSIGCEASGSVVVSEPSALSVSTVVIDEQTFQGCDGSATANPSGGTAPYTYDWSDGQTTQTASNLCPGTYTVTVTDANGCTETVTITVNPLLCTGFSVAINTYGLSCFEAGDGAAVAVVTGGTAPFTYSWSNGGTTDSIGGLDAGQYTVTVTDAVNCSQTVSGNVSQPALLEAATAVDNVTCNGLDNGVIELTVTGGTSPYSFSWDNGSTVEDLENLSPGTYNVSVTDAHGCTTTASGTVTEPDTLDASSVDVNVTCFEGSDGSIDLTVSGGLGPYLYDWDNGETTEDISGLSAGTYTVTIVDQNGCVFVYSTTLTESALFEPEITADGPLEFCDLEDVVLTATEGASYLWSPNGETTQSITVTESGTYSVLVTSLEGCVGEAEAVTVTVFDLPTPIITAGGPIEFCDGDSVVLTSTPGSSYEWVPNGETTQSITVYDAGSYNVIVTDQNGCSDISPRIDVFVNPNPIPTITADGPTTFCEVESVTLTASAADSYLWSPGGETTQSITVNTAGDYTVSVIDENGCEGTSDAITISIFDNPQPVITASGPLEFCEGDSVILSTDLYASYVWLPNGETSQSVTVYESGTYSVVVTDANGCTGEAQAVTVTKFQTDSATITPSGNTVFCDGKEIALVASEGTSYVWYPNGETTQIINVGTSGNYVVTITDDNGCVSISDTMVVIVNPVPDPIITASGPTSFCEGDSIILTSTEHFQYEWFPNGETSQSITVFETGQYVVEVTDTNGCSATADTVDITVFDVDEATITVNGPLEFCDGNEITLSSSTGVSYEWSPNGETTQTISVGASGSYTVTVTDANGCESTSDTIDIIVNPNPQPVVTPDGTTEFCEGGSVMLTSTASDAYLWDPNGETTQSIVVDASGDYSVTVTDENGCEGTSNVVSVTVYDLPEVTVSASGPLEFCEGESVTLTANSALGYEWSPTGDTTQSITVTESGIYSVEVTDGNGCTNASDDIEVTVFEIDSATVSVNGPIDFCDGDEVVLTASGGVGYEWFPNGETTTSITVTQTGTYSVEVTDANGCRSTSALVEVTVYDNPVPTISLSGPSTFCLGDSVILTSSDAVSYLWDPNSETTQEITVFDEGTYSVTVVDTNGCNGSSAEVILTHFAETPSSITAGGPTTFCDGDEVILTASSGQGYMWLPNGETTQSITATEAGTYTVAVLDQNGCFTTSDSVEIELYDLPTVTVQADGPTEFCVGESVDLIATSGNVVTYQWSENGIDLSGETNPILNVGGESLYTVTVVDTNGCSSSADAPALTVGPAPNAFAGPDGWLCPGDSIVLTATGGDHYLWNDGSTSASITVSPQMASEYTVIVTNDNCGLESSDTVEVMLYSSPTALIEADETGMLENDVLFFDGSGDSSIVLWDWDFGDDSFDDVQNPEHTFHDEGYFTVILTVENEFGCTAQDTVEIEIIQVIDIPNVFTPNDDNVNDELEIRNNGVTDYEITIYNRWGIIMHHDVSGEIFWDGRTPAGLEAKAGTYFYIIVVNNDFSEGNFEQTGTVTLIR